MVVLGVKLDLNRPKRHTGDMLDRLTRFITTAVCACMVLLAAVPGHAELNPVVMEDWSAEIGLADLEGPTYTAGWLDVDLDGDDEPIWLRSDGLYYLDRDADGKTVLQQATVEAQGDTVFFANPEGQPSLVSGDFDRNGTLDLMVIQRVVRLYEITEPGKLVEMNAHLPYLPLGPVPFDVAAGDLNGDGWPDVAIAQARSGTEHLYQRGAIDIVLMNRGGHFERIALEPAMRKQSGALAIADIDHDGRLDVIESVTFSRSSGLSRILLNKTEPGARYPTFEPAEHTFDQGSMGMGVAIEDIDQDGHLDLFHASTGNDFLMFGSSDGPYVDRTWELGVNHEWTTNAGPRIQWAPTIIDLNADGRLDLYERHGHVEAGIETEFQPDEAQEHLLYAQKADGTFERMPAPFDPDPTHNGTDAAMGDFNGDGLPELATGGLFNELGQPSVGRPVFWFNATEKNPNGRALAVRLQPTVSTLPPTGAWVKATCADQSWTRTLTSGGHVGALASSQLLFAWSDCKADVALEIHWPSGAVSVATSPAGETRHDASEPVWTALEADGNGGLQVTLNPENSGDEEACFLNDSQSEWQCCSVADAPCVFPYTPKAGDHGAIRLSESNVTTALQPLGGWQTIATYPRLPKPNEQVIVSLLHGGIADSFGLGDAWLRFDKKKLAMESDVVGRRRTSVLEGLPTGTDLELTLFEGITVQEDVSVPNGYALDPRWLEEAVYPNRNADGDRPWRIYLTPKPHHPNEEFVKLNNVSARLHPKGSVLPALVTRDHTGRLRVDVEWDDIPAGQQVAIYEDDALRAGPYPVRKLTEPGDTEAHLRRIEGMFSRAVVVEGGDVVRFIFTCYDEDGHTMPPAYDLLDVELDGLVMEGDLTIPMAFGGGWETSMMLRTKPGAGTASVRIALKNGKELGLWELMRRAPKNVPVSTDLTTFYIEQSTLPAGVGAKTVLRVMPRGDHGELLGRDAPITIAGPPEIVVGQTRVNESGLYEAVVEPGHYGGMYDIEVRVGDDVLTTIPFEVIGPAMPGTSVSSVDWPNDEDSDEPVADGPSTDTVETPLACSSSGGAPMPFGYLLLLAGWLVWRTLRRRTA